MRVLLLEDQETLRNSTRAGLEELGFAVDAVEDGDIALEQALGRPSAGPTTRSCWTSWCRAATA